MARTRDEQPPELQATRKRMKSGQIVRFEPRSKDVRLEVRLPRLLMDKFKARARERGITTPALIRTLIEREIGH
jgi:predicted DNA binding CopG/RHH family protein